MTIGSRRGKRDGFFDAQAPALWISNGIGRDSPDNRNAPKIGWCWAGNRHTQLGFASATTRIEMPTPPAHNDARTSRTTSSDITTYSAFGAAIALEHPRDRTGPQREMSCRRLHRHRVGHRDEVEVVYPWPLARQV